MDEDALTPLHATALGREGVQSALRPMGEGAEQVADMALILTLGATAIFLTMIALGALSWRGVTGGKSWWIWGGGILFPAVVLAAFTVFAGVVMRGIAGIGGEEGPALVVEVTGHQFWWDVVYDPDGAAIRDANELILPVGQPVELRLKAADVIHSFWIPSISGKLDMIPGRVNVLTVEATETGRFRGQCAEFCGIQHPRMAFETVVAPAEEVAAFLADLAGEARDAATPLRLRGREVFLEQGCAACHEIRGVSTGARLGPDLTRVGGRGTLGAGMWRMNQGALAGWIVDVQDMKPGAKMPSYTTLSGPDLRALSAWLESLK